MTPAQEEHIGKLMMHSARREGHRKGFPKAPAKIPVAGKFTSPLALKIMDYMQNGKLQPSSKIADAIDRNRDSVRSSLGRLHQAGRLDMELVDGVMNFKLNEKKEADQ